MGKLKVKNEPVDRVLDVKIQLELSQITDGLSSDQAAAIVKDIVGAVGSYELDFAVFAMITESFVQAVENRYTEAEIKLEMDEAVTKFVDEFRAALHGEPTE